MEDAGWFIPNVLHVADEFGTIFITWFDEMGEGVKFNYKCIAFLWKLFRFQFNKNMYL